LQQIGLDFLWCLGEQRRSQQKAKGSEAKVQAFHANKNRDNLSTIPIFYVD